MNNKIQQNLLVDISVFGQFAWMLNLYRFGKIDPNNFLKFYREINFSEIDITSIFRELIIEKEDAPFDWDDWEAEEPKTGKVYYSQDAQDWLLFAFVFYGIVNKSLSFISKEDFNKKSYWLISEINKFLIEIDKFLETKWRLIIPKLSIEVIKERIVSLQSSLEELHTLCEKQNDLKIIEKPISEKNVKRFKELNYKSWIRVPPIYKLFERFNNLEIISSTETSLNKRKGYDRIIINGKHLFLEEEMDYLISFSDYGHVLREDELKLFIDSLPTPKKIPPYKRMADGLGYLIERLDQKNYNPSLLIMNRRLTLYDREFQKNEKFKSSFFTVEKYDRLLTDSYDGIPIFYLDKDRNEKKIYICQFDVAMTMKQKRNEGWYNGILDIRVSEIGDDEAKKIIDDEPEIWLYDKEGNKIPEADALIKIKKSIKLYVGSEIDFEILDTEAFEVCEIEDIPKPNPFKKSDG